MDAIIESIRDTEPRRLSWGILFLYSNIRFIAFIFVSCWMLDDNELPSDNPTLQVQFPLHTSIITVDIAIFRGALYLYLLGVKIRFNSHQMVPSPVSSSWENHTWMCVMLYSKLQGHTEHPALAQHIITRSDPGPVITWSR